MSILSSQRNAPSFFVRQTNQVDQYKKQLKRKKRKIILNQEEESLILMSSKQSVCPVKYDT
jgi:hypothetical protein